jgi:phage tail sheath gpL-like
MNFEQISSSRRTPGVETEVNTKGASQNPPANKQRIMIVGQRMSAVISTPSFVESSSPGNVDCTLSGTAAFTGSVLRKFIVEITGTGTPDTFRWSKDNGATWTTGVSCATGDITLTEGVVITFGSTTGHAVGDKWTFVAFPAGTVDQLTPTRVLRVGDASGSFGRGSVLHRAIKACLATAEHYGQIDINATAMDDAAGAAAEGSITVTGPATAAGWYRIRIGGAIFQVAFSKDDTAAEIALALKGELDRDAGLDLPVTFHRDSSSLAKLVFKSKHLGTVNNDLKIEAEYTSNAGVGATVVQPTGGNTDPSNFASALDSFQAERYHVIGTCIADATTMAALATQIDVLNGPNVQKWAIGVGGSNTGTLSTATTLAAGVNDWESQLVWFKGSYSPGYEIMGAYCAVKAYIEDAAEQLNHRELFGIHIPSVADRVDETDIETALWNGVTPIKVNRVGRAAIVRAISTDVEHDWAVDITTATSLQRFQDAFVRRCESVFVGPAAKNLGESTVKAVVSQALFVARQLEGEGVLRKIKEYKSQFVGEEDPGDANRINVACPSPVVPGLHRICGRFDLVWGG